jgi:predicted acylesterase/phospholipase RssA
LKSRLKGVLRDVLTLAWRWIRRAGGTLSAESLFLRSGDLLGPPLHGNEFERILRGLFAVSGTTNDFRKLARPLFIGATDQDLRTHVIFGGDGFEDIPISKAIQASFAVNPAFTSTRIGQRYYEDGAVTRTSNFEDAIRRGADLIFVIDPFVPYVSKTAGYTRKRGLLYNIDQDIRTISHTRFEARRADALRYNPHVSSYTFLPANSLRQLMSVNPMDHRPYLQIWRGAYLSTLQRINLLRYRLRGDIATHGMTLDTTRAEVVADRLRRLEVPEFADFFPDRRIELRLMPLGFTEHPPLPVPPVQALPIVEPTGAVG